MHIPRKFCWTRFGAEAGESVAQIFARKEKERLQNGGIFLWGIGNAVGPSMQHLLRVDTKPKVIFSPIQSAARKQDSAPDQIVVWTTGRALDGQYYKLPTASIVTSRFKQGPRGMRHFALVCSSAASLEINHDPMLISFGKLKNIRTNRPVGHSQVTAVVKYDDRTCTNSTLSYPAAVQTQLVFPYFLELRDPVLIPKQLGAQVASLARNGMPLKVLLEQFRRYSRTGATGNQLALFPHGETVA